MTPTRFLQEIVMSRGNLLVLTLALALAVSPSLAVETKPAPTMGKSTPAEPPVRLTLDNFNRLMKAEKALAETNRDSNLEHAFAMHGDTDTIRRWGAQVEADKRYEAPLKSAGLSPSEYTRTLVAVLQAYAVSGLQKQNKEIPAELKAHVPAENIAFVDKHAAEIESWGLRAGKGPVKPNTMEDVYVEQATPGSETTKTAGAEATPSAGAPAEKPAAAKPAAEKKKKSKDAAKTDPKSEPQKP